MSDPIRIESLIPQPLPDMRRVSLLLRVSGLPTYGFSAGSHSLSFPDMPQPQGEEPDDQADRPPPTPNVTMLTDAPSSHERQVESPYPDVTLSILDQHGQEITTTYIVEHKEPELDFTLHFPKAEPGTTYIARAVLSVGDQAVQTVQAPFQIEERT